MKQLLILHTCAITISLYKTLITSLKYTEQYKTEIVRMYPYYDKNSNVFDKSDIKKIQNCDILICTTGFVGKLEFARLENIKNLLKNECQIIKIPNYVMNGYFYVENITHPAINGINKRDLIFSHKNKIDSENIYKESIDNLFHDKHNEINEFMRKSLISLKEIDDTSDIKIYDFIEKNYKKYKLFCNPCYPAYGICYILAVGIINKLEINDNIKQLYPLDHPIGIPIIPIMPQVKIALGLEFDVINYKTSDGTEKTVYEFCRGGDIIYNSKSYS